MTTMTEVKERPILFSAPMVRAILDGEKTQTRRVVKPKYNEPFNRGNEIIEWREQEGMWFGLIGWRTAAHCKCPYEQPGDRLWVRETFSSDPANIKVPFAYRATYHDEYNHLAGEDEPRWKPSIHMPSWASRITLEVTGVRIERLHDISESDALAEGVGLRKEALDIVLTKPTFRSLPIAMYRELWESINGPDSWADNPWVWVIEFSKL